MILTVVIVVVVALLAYVRLVSSDPKRWHRLSSKPGMGEITSEGGFIWREPVLGDGADKLRAFDDAALSTPRTVRLAGSADEGLTTYVTRSKVFGFPDYTTIGIRNDSEQTLEVNGRLRFGRSDLGVNRKRIEGWRAAVEG